MKVLVTGGAGFIGANFTKAALGYGWDVTVLDNLSTGLRNQIPTKAEFFEGSVTSIDDVRAAAKNASTVVHLAALGSVPRSISDPISSHEANVNGTLNVLEIAREQNLHVIYSSSSSVYGRNLKLPKSEMDWTAPISPYGASKLAAESYVCSYQEAYGLRTLALRFFNVFGPLQRADHQYAAVIPKWIDAALRGETLTVFGDGTQTRDFTFVDFVVDLLLRACMGKITHPIPVNAALGEPHALLEVIDQIGRHFESMKIDFAPPRTGDIRNSENDARLLLELFPDVKRTKFEDAIDETVRWYKRQNL